MDRFPRSVAPRFSVRCFVGPGRVFHGARVIREIAAHGKSFHRLSPFFGSFCALSRGVSKGARRKYIARARVTRRLVTRHFLSPSSSTTTTIPNCNCERRVSRASRLLLFYYGRASSHRVRRDPRITAGRSDNKRFRFSSPFHRCIGTARE